MKKAIIAIAAVVFAGSLAVSNAALAHCGACGSGETHAEHAKHTHSIYDTAKGAGFTTLVAAVDAAGLTETLSNDGPFTVFAPTDEAFKALPEGALEGLLADKKALTNVLLFHVVKGEVKAADVVKLESAEMLNGEKAKVKVKKDTVMIAGVKVVKTDIIASNGVIHVIDAVMLPGNDGQASNR
jgi:uncharacterized surface protein with fasciclin (FAS1) repeats